MTLDDGAAERPDQAGLSVWQQGDCVLGDHWFVHRALAATESTGDSHASTDEGDVLVETPVAGFAVLSQTCDIIRNWDVRPFVEISPLVEVEKSTFRQVEHGYRPQYAYIPGVAGKLLVADLDRVMAIEKRLIVRWERVVGCLTPRSARKLADALARKRARFAFPDDFRPATKRLVDRLSEKHDRQTPEGSALRALDEIRVLAEPSWDADSVELMFYFIRNPDAPDAQGVRWDDWLRRWLALVPSVDRYSPINGMVVTLDDLTARDYAMSDKLDLDSITSR